MAVSLHDAIAQTGCISQPIHRSDVGNQTTTNIQTTVSCVHTVAHCQWVTCSILNILGSSIPNRVLICVGRRSHHVAVRVPCGSIEPTVLHVLTHVVQVVNVGRSQRVDRYNGVEERLITIAYGNSLPLLNGGVARNLQPFREPVVSIQLNGEALVSILVALHDTIVVNDAETCEEVTLFVTTTHREVMLEAPAVSKHLVVPVSIDFSVFVSIVLDHVVIDVANVLLILLIVSGIEDFSLLAQRLGSCLQGVRNSCTTRCTLLRGHENNTITCLSTIDSCTGSILQNFDTLNHGWVQIRDIIYLHTIHDEQWAEVATIGRITTYTNLSTSTRSTAVDDLHTCHLALQSCSSIGSGKVLDFVTLHGCHGTSQVALLLHTITDDYHVIQCLHILVQTNGKIVLVAHFHLLSEEANIRKLERWVVASWRQAETSVSIRNGSVACAFFHNFYTNQGFRVVRRNHLSLN